MIFLIHYDRSQGQIVSMEQFDDRERGKAEGRRLSLELRLRKSGGTGEVVLLEAATEDALRRTHRRYFENAREILESADKELK